jgi:hypothetical protein
VSTPPRALSTVHKATKAATAAAVEVENHRAVAADSVQPPSAGGASSAAHQPSLRWLAAQARRHRARPK